MDVTDKNMVIMYVVCANTEQASKIGRLVLEKRLAACINIFPIKSAYWWQNEIVEDNEAVLLIKTLNENCGEITALVKQEHTYEVPCIMRLEVDWVEKNYLDWLKGEVRI